MALITAAAALATLTAAGRVAVQMPAPAGSCRTLRYRVDGQPVNLARLRALAREAMATPAPAPADPAPADPAAAPARRPRLEPVALALAAIARRYSLAPHQMAPFRAAALALQDAGQAVTVRAILRAVESAPTPAPAPDDLTAAREDLAVALAGDDLSPDDLTRAQDDLTLAMACGALEPTPAPRPALPGETLPPAPAPRQGPGVTLPDLRADAAAGRPVSLSTLARAISDDRAAARAAHPGPVGQPWDPGTPDARARVADQGARVAILWAIAQAARGAGVTLPASWASDGPAMAGEWPLARAMAGLWPDAIKAAAVALAALPPVTRAQDDALALCRAALAGWPADE